MFGDHLKLAVHSEKVLYDFGKILGGGAFGPRLSDFAAAAHITEEDIRDYRTLLMINLAEEAVEFVVSNSTRCEQLLKQGYETQTITRWMKDHDRKRW